jgi:hypothetical protein
MNLNVKNVILLLNDQNLCKLFFIQKKMNKIFILFSSDSPVHNSNQLLTNKHNSLNRQEQIPIKVLLNFLVFFF